MVPIPPAGDVEAVVVPDVVVPDVVPPDVVVVAGGAVVEVVVVPVLDGLLRTDLKYVAGAVDV
jgi:hypothetical protein